MAYAVLVAAERRIHGDPPAAVVPPPLLRPAADGTSAFLEVAVEERPPLRSLRPVRSGETAR